jgi:hypothetical protein
MDLQQAGISRVDYITNTFMFKGKRVSELAMSFRVTQQLKLIYFAQPITVRELSMIRGLYLTFNNSYTIEEYHELQENLLNRNWCLLNIKHEDAYIRWASNEGLKGV